MTALTEQETREPLCCSFCGRSQHEVRFLVAGPSSNSGPPSNICDECATLCVDIMDHRKNLNLSRDWWQQEVAALEQGESDAHQ